MVACNFRWWYALLAVFPPRSRADHFSGSRAALVPLWTKGSCIIVSVLTSLYTGSRAQMIEHNPKNLTVAANGTVTVTVGAHAIETFLLDVGL